MELLQVRDFGSAGLNTDLPIWDLPLQALSNAKNFRILNNKLKAYGGHSSLGANPPGFTGEHILFSPTESNNYWILAGNSVYVWDGVAFTDLGTSLSGFAQDPRWWTSCHLGRVPVLNNVGYAPIHWASKDTSTDFAPLPYDSDETWVDKQWKCRAMRSYGPYLIAMYMYEGIDIYPDVIRWSHPAERNSVPPTWNEADPASLASINILGGDAGAVVDGLALRNSFVIYRDFGVTVLDYRDDNYVFNARNLTETVNIAHINCIAEVKGVHFIAAANDIVMNDGTTIKSILHNRMRVNYSNNLNADAAQTMFAVHNTNVKEVWFFLPMRRATFPNEVWAYNYENNTISTHEVQSPHHADFGRYEGEQFTWNDWNFSWEDTNFTWARTTDTPFNNTLIGAGDFMMNLETDSSEVSFDTIIERTNYPLTTMQDVCTITRIYPHVKGSKPVKIQVGSHEFAGGPIRWKSNVSFDPRTDRKIDVRTTGELFAFRITTTDNFNFEFSGLDIEYVQDGLR